MKAMLIHKYGEPDVFQFGEIEKPQIEDNEVLVKTEGSSVNPVDAGIRRGLLRSFVRLKLPSVLGVDLSGEVVQTGKKVTKFKAGDKVYAFNGIFKNGGYGEFVAVPESFAAKTPQNITPVEAGVVPGVGLTAYEGLTLLAPVKQGMKILINGGGGGVGTFAIQIAKAMGATVTSVNSASKNDLVKGLGADHVIDYKVKDIFTDTERYDIIFNCVRGASSSKLKKLLKLNGKILIITGNPLSTPFVKIANWFSSKKSISFMVKTSGKNLAGLTKLIEEGKVKPVIEKTFSWRNLAEAHSIVEQGRVAGKIAIEIT